MRVESRKIIKRLRGEGWRLIRTTGSHHHFVHHDLPHALVTVPHPKRDIPMGTLRSIFKQAGWEKP